jgi:3-deoxy-manno-octulosonate cytidylyltransferase (CMP-KDO synthetase)
MNILAIIPARMGSSRFPGKPMKKIHGIPMIGHCYYRTNMCNSLFCTYVATCDQEIFDYIESIGGNVVMTSDKHDRATDRTAEAMIKIEKLTGKIVDLVVMVQGDEPMITPNMIDKSIEPLLNNSLTNVVNLMSHMGSIEEFEDPNEVKVVVNNLSNAIYFSREPIPSRKKGSSIVPMLKQVCIIPFRRDYLLKFNDMPETNLEKIESVDMMRIIENGEKIAMVMVGEETFSVDTKEDLINVEEKMRNDQFIKEYR